MLRKGLGAREQGKTHNFKVTALVRGILRTLKGAAKMKG